MSLLDFFFIEPDFPFVSAGIMFIQLIMLEIVGAAQKTFSILYVEKFNQ